MRDGPSRPFNVSTYFYDAGITFISLVHIIRTGVTPSKIAVKFTLKLQ